MSDLYPDLAKVATQLLSTFGKSRQIIVHFKSQCTRDPVAGTVSGTYPTTSIKGVVLRPDSKLMSDVRMVGNSSIMNNDRMVLLPATITLADSDVLEFDGHTWPILKLDPINPGGVLVLNKLWVRR